MVARAYAAAVSVCGLGLIYLAGVITQTHAAGGAIMLLVPGVAFVVLAPLIWCASRLAMIAALAASIAFAAVFAYQDPGYWWLALPICGLFVIFTVAAIATGAKAETGGRWRAPNAAALYAVVVYLYGAVVAFQAPTNYARGLVFVGPPLVTAYALVLGAVFAGLSIAIWRGRLWAMIAAFVVALLHWLALAGLDASYWRDPSYWTAPLVFGVLSAIWMARLRKGTAA